MNVAIRLFLNKVSQNKSTQLVIKKSSQSIICHSKRSEESLILEYQTLRCAQGDNFKIVSKTKNLV